MKAKIIAAPIFALILLFTSCGLITSLKAALASAGPLVTVLARSGAINEANAQAILRDFSDGVTVAEELNANIKIATTKGMKAAAALKAERKWIEIINRGDFGTNLKIQTAANIADGIFASIVLFYGGVPTSMAHVPPSASNKSDKDMKMSIEAQIDHLKRTLEK